MNRSRAKPQALLPMPRKLASTSIHKRPQVLQINASSTEALKLDDNNLEVVKTVTYLGRVINQQGDIKTSI
jgi:hypothetical protein